MPQPIQPMPEEASRILQQQLIQLLNHASAGEVVSFAFAVELVVEDEETDQKVQQTYYGNFQITDSLVAMLTKMQALVVAKCLRVEQQNPVKQMLEGVQPMKPLELTDEILSTIQQLNAQVVAGIMSDEGDHPDVPNTDPSLDS